jgi:hypothetical protein
MKTREIDKNINKLMTDTYNCYSVHIALYDNIKQYRDLKWKFYSRHNFCFLLKWEDIWKISDIYSKDINFKTLKPQIKKILWEYFWFWWRVKNLFR